MAVFGKVILFIRASHILDGLSERFYFIIEEALL